LAKEAKPASLMQVTTTARRFVVGCLVFLLLAIVYQVVRDRIVSPGTLTPGTSDPFLAANNLFGKDLPALSLESLSLAEGSTPEFGVENRFGEFPKNVNVYKVLKPRERFGTVETGEEVAGRLAFTGPFAKLSETELQWKSATRTLTFEKVLKRWKFETNYSSDAKAQATHKINPDKDAYESGAKTVLSSVGLRIEELERSNGEVYFMNLENGQLKEVSSPSSADFAQVQLFWQRVVATPKDKIFVAGTSVPNETAPIVGNVYRENPVLGSSTVILSDAGTSIDNLYAFELTQWEIDPVSGVYAIITPEEAWDKVQKGEAFLRQLVRNGKSPLGLYEPLVVKRFVTSNEDVSIGYFESTNYSEYELPIYVFKGRAELADGGEAEFVFYVDALKR